MNESSRDDTDGDDAHDAAADDDDDDQLIYLVSLRIRPCTQMPTARETVHNDDEMVFPVNDYDEMYGE